MRAGRRAGLETAVLHWGHRRAAAVLDLAVGTVLPTCPSTT